ncbi:MAG: HlyD family efflux transporter periplasmic adaptor subunit [Parachlamydia sp.]|nr:HlyD family efflux transporter periplasmic adaptor subunit [Parachlamydia sp.]
MTPSDKAAYQGAIQALGLAQRLTLKAVSAKDLQSLIFIILNDTYHLFPYDRAVLWRLTAQKAEMLGVSGQATYTTSSELVNNWKSLLAALPNPSEAKILTATDFPQQISAWNFVQPKTPMKVMWVPILSSAEETVGIWFERWNEPQEAPAMQENAKVLIDHLIPGYTAAWEQRTSHLRFRRLKDQMNRNFLGTLAVLLLLSLFAVRIPLRVTAPCEVVGNAPYVVTAPQEGIIEAIAVQPGQRVSKGDVLFTYDRRIPLQDLKVAQKEVAVLQAEANRLMAMGVDDNQAVAELSIARLKLQKGVVDLDYAQQRVGQLTGTSPENGVVIVEKPDEWRGRPVKIGEKIMVVSNPSETKVRIWVPESDNIHFNRTERITIFLNPDPTQSYAARLTYLSPEITLTDQRIPSFLAEAEWAEQPKNMPLGVKGTAILYGDRVSLFYYIMRKPIATLRRFTGI